MPYDINKKTVTDNKMDDDATLTTKHGYFAVYNATSDKELTRIYVKHHCNAFKLNDAVITTNNLKAGYISERKSFPYEVGFNADFDYWYIEVDYKDAAGNYTRTFKTKENFFCNVNIHDNGLVLISIYMNERPKDGYHVAQNARVDFSYSYGCDVSLNYFN